jgi:hypothetical protein
VEILDERTESSSTFANPDGSLTQQAFAGPVRMRRGDGWTDVDLTLQTRADGAVVPRAHPGGLVLAGPGAATSTPRPLASLGAGKRAAALLWSGRLPRPVLTGDTATYPDALPGADVVVQATRTGVEQFTVLKTRPSKPLTLRLPLRLAGLTAAKTPAGDLQLRDAAGRAVGVLPAPVMWDATVDAFGDHPRRAPWRGP